MSEEDIAKVRQLILYYQQLGKDEGEIYKRLAIDDRDIQALENLISRNEQLEEYYKNEQIVVDKIKYKIIADSFHEKMAKKFDEDFIPKSRVEEKIEEIKKDVINKNTYPNYSEQEVLREIVEVLQELLD